MGWIELGGKSKPGGERRRLTSLTVAVDALLAVVAVVSALSAIATIRVHIHATIALALLVRRHAHALARNTRARRSALPVALAAVVGIARKIAATDIGAALGLSRRADALPGHAHTHAASDVAHAARLGIR